MTYVKVNGNLYPATINGKMNDRDWDNRESKAITLEGDYATVDSLFPDGAKWSIVMDDVYVNEDGEETPIQNEYDNSEFFIRGDLAVHTDGTCTVKMGKQTELEKALSGAVTTDELDAAYTEGVNEA